MVAAVILLLCLFFQFEIAEPNDTAWQYDDEDFTSGSGVENEQGQEKIIHCCAFGNFTFHDILKNVTSDKIIINVTTDVVLSSIVTLKDLENITIIGHKDPVVNCNDFGAVKFIFCKNVIIEGLHWEGCGSKDYPGIEFHESCNVSFERCSFHNSKGRNVLLSLFSEDVLSNFAQDDRSRNGRALNHSANNNNHNQFTLIIHNCEFNFNAVTQSVVYIDGTSSRISGHVNLQDNMFIKNKGTPVYVLHTNLLIKGSVLFKENVADNAGGIYSNNSTVIFYSNANVSFIRNSAKLSGGVIEVYTSRIIFEENSVVVFKNNSAYSGGAIYIESSNITFDGYTSVTFNNNEAYYAGGAVYCTKLSHIKFHDNSSVTFTNNKAKNGGALCCLSSNLIIFCGNVTFKNNEASNDGGAMYCHYSTDLMFDNDSSVVFDNNKANDDGGAVFFQYFSHITFCGNSSVTFNRNKAAYGGAVLCEDSSPITFDSSSRVTFSNNVAIYTGAALSCRSSSHVTFDDKSSVIFNSNKVGKNAGAVYCRSSAHLTFDGNSSVIFNNNEANQHGGAVYCEYLSLITFVSNSSVKFHNNKADINAGAVFFRSLQHMTFDDNSTVTFAGNKASNDGGALYCLASCNITFKDNTKVIFKTNIADDWGGAISCGNHCNVQFYKSTSVMFINNSALTGGAILSQGDTSAKGNSTVQFIHNTATEGGAIYSRNQATISLKGNCVMTFNGNNAEQSGGAVYITTNSKAILTGYSKVTFSNNSAMQYGGAIYCSGNSIIVVDQNISVEFINSTSEFGGALSVIQSHFTCKGRSLVNSINNNAERGGTFYALLSNVTLKGNISMTFIGNKAENGGAISAVKSTLTFEEKSQLSLINNSAAGNGGAIHLSDDFTANILHNSNITFYQNTANSHGGAIYCDLTKSSENKIIFNTTDIVFDNNIDLTSSDTYVDMPTSCDGMCLNNSIRYDNFNGDIKTSPRKVKFNDSTVTCVDYDGDASCQLYLTKNIMLGQEIIANACVLDYYNQRAEPTQFILSYEGQDHHITRSYNVLISCRPFEGVSIMGGKILEATNFSMKFTSHSGSTSAQKEFSMRLIIELSPCHVGFQYDNASETCVCYSDSNIVTCSGYTSSIKRGYWFGEVNDETTVTNCPNSYCNFSCCETANGFFKLSPVRTNQCNSQRSGTACGSCKEGYTLSFDSIECVSVEKCTTGQTVLVVTLSVLYWVFIVISVFIVTYYHIGIGYLYAIAYYYSMVDILLSGQLYLTQGLFTFVSIVSSFTKVTPQFLGQLCLVANMSGIDQQFIHYVHPLAVAVIIVLICISARISYKFSTFVSRGIIQVICLLLLLSYTSVATTSLLLLRPLTFDNVENIYTYLSPDIKYLHGRHLPYFIIATLFSLIIVMGLPLLLFLEPFLNHKINFSRMKPLLDQFQGCYKDKCRSFAAYYMICRLVKILMIITNPSISNISQYSLIITNATLALVHVSIRPYGCNILNVFDGFVLHLMIVVSMVPLIDSYNSDLLLAFMFILAMLPLFPFLAMELYIYKNKIRKITTYCVPPKPDAINNDNNEVPMRDFVDSAVDDSRRLDASMHEM